MRASFALVLVLAACGQSQPFKLDAGNTGGNGGPTVDALVVPYSHTIDLDGMDTFAPGEDFYVTTPGYGARIAWDQNNVYLGYVGSDLSTTTADADTKWLFAYIDIDPGNGTGAGSAQIYNTQTQTFPPGFGAEYYLRWKCDGTLTSIEQFDVQTQMWSTAMTPQYARSGTFVELAIPASLFAGSLAVGLETYMIDEGSGSEDTYAGIYPSNFVDGYSVDMMLTRYLRADFTSPLEPNNLDNEEPPLATGSDSGDG
jgi:hypothetical protein